MCIVIDTNAFSSVFNERASDHPGFKPVRDWIEVGKGKAVYGGTRYEDELKKATKYLGTFAELARARKVVRVCSSKVDLEQHRMEQLIDDDSFDDAHLAAIVAVSGCKLVCTNDKSSHQFLTDPSIYPRTGLRPRIYTGLRNGKLLCDKNIAKCCKNAPKCGK
jgi:predicted nucleic acid-binding protein